MASQILLNLLKFNFEILFPSLVNFNNNIKNGIEKTIAIKLI